MARKITAVVAKLWIYIDEKLDKDGTLLVQELKGDPKKGTGSHFAIKPTPYDLILEAGMGGGTIKGLDKRSVVMANILSQSVDDWFEVAHPETGDFVEFEGPDSVDLLPHAERSALAAWIYQRITESAEGNLGSASSRSGKSGSGKHGAGRGTAKRARRSGRKRGSKA